MSFPSVGNSPESSIFDGSPYIQIQTSTHGGRSIFAISDIAPGTRVHSSETPFAHVIFKEYRKEVCAHCFAYSSSDQALSTVGRSRTWGIKWNRAGAAAAWFCSDDCKNNWERDEVSLLLMKVDALLTKGQAATRKRLKSPDEQAKVESMLPSFEPGDKTITQEVIDAAWERAKTIVSSKAHLALTCSTLHLEDMELEIARSLTAAIVRRYCDQRCAPDSTARNRIESWSQLLNLQTNELCCVQTRPHMLTAYLRIYVFLSRALPEHLQRYAPTIREVLARDTGNAFGIWDGDRRDEMMGWGIWVSASYFNHSCTPNVRKRREGRALHFEAARGIRAGEELCISYIDADSPVEQRRRELAESWFFACRCLRCVAES